MDEVRDLFPITREFAYLNHAETGPLPTPVRQAVAQFLDGQCEGGSVFMNTLADQWPKIKRKMAALINAAPEEVAVTKNTPEGISLVASGLPWQPGDNVVTTGLEFPANVYPWLNVQRFGVETRFVPPRHGRIPLEDLLSAADDRTRVISVSMVEFSNGFRHNVDAIGEFCRPRNIRFVVDAIQGLGVLPIDVKRSKIDYLAGASHKWLCCPHGVGWFYCRRELLDELWPTEVGQGSVIMPGDSFLEYNFVLKPTAQRFEGGVYNHAGVIGLGAALDLFMGIGTETIERRILALTDLLVAQLHERGYSVLSSRAPGEKSGVVLFKSERHSSEELLAALTAAKVVVSLREGGIRVSPSFYNNEEDVMRLIRALPET